jgi:phospholipid transport system substrate-binding protein
MSAKFQSVFRGLAAFICAIAITLTFAAQQARAASDAEAYIQQTGDEASAILNNDSLSDSAKRDAISHMIDTRLDLDRIAKFTLGKYARTATDAEKAEYVPLLKQYVINFYVNNLVTYHKVKVKVTGSTDRGGDQGTIVGSQIFAGADQPVAANWWVVAGKSGPTIFDAQFHGIWIAQNLRSTLVTVMDESGGKVSAGIAKLREQINGA